MHVLTYHLINRPSGEGTSVSLWSNCPRETTEIVWGKPNGPSVRVRSVGFPLYSYLLIHTIQKYPVWTFTTVSICDDNFTDTQSVHPCELSFSSIPYIITQGPSFVVPSPIHQPTDGVETHNLEQKENITILNMWLSKETKFTCTFPLRSQKCTVFC